MRPDDLKKGKILRRDAFKGLGVIGAVSLVGFDAAKENTASARADYDWMAASPIRQNIFQLVQQTPFIDTHEHLIEEKDRLSGHGIAKDKSDDWTLLFSQYLDADMRSAGMPDEAYNEFFKSGVDPVKKWEILKPYWPSIRNTGYGQAVALTIANLYGVAELSDQTIGKLQSEYEKIRRPGFYRHILRERANIESCQVNTIAGRPFTETEMPDLLMQDLSIRGMIEVKDKIAAYAKPAGIDVKILSDWHRVIDWWFEKYGTKAVAVKSQHAYDRNLDHEWVEANRVEPAFQKLLTHESAITAETKSVEDHLFWYCVKKATECHLPVKLHTGYYSGVNKMPLDRLLKNPGSASDICRTAFEADHVPHARFVFMHIAYPYYEPMIALAKHYTHAYVDMCWSWLINPIAAKDFLKKFLVTAPTNKILTFGGDYRVVEPVLGHAILARRGIALAIAELVEEGWLSLKQATELIPLIMNGNAKKLFRLGD